MNVVTEKEARLAMASCGLYDSNQLVGTHYIVEASYCDIYTMMIWCVDTCQHRWNTYITQESRLPDSHPMKNWGAKIGFIFTNWSDAAKFELRYPKLARRYNS